MTESKETYGPAHPIRAILATIDPTDRDQCEAKIIDLEAELDEFEDDGTLDSEDCWLDGFFYLRELENVDWSLQRPSFELAADFRAGLAFDTEKASLLEATLTDWLIQVRPGAAHQNPDFAAFSSVFEIEDAERYVAPGTQLHTFTLLRAAEEVRLGNNTSQAIHFLNLAEEALARQSADPRLAKGLIGLERASCLQGLGRHSDAVRELTELAQWLASWNSDPATQDGTGQMLSVRLGIALIRQHAHSNRHERALSGIKTLRAELAESATVDPQMAGQLHYYEALALRGLDAEDIEGPEVCLEQALAIETLLPSTRGMALLEQASLRIDFEDFEGAQEALQGHREFLGSAGGKFAMQRIRNTVFTARIARLRGMEPSKLSEHLDLVRVAYVDFQASWQDVQDGLGIGTLAFSERRFLMDELIELALASSTESEPAFSALDATLPTTFEGGRPTGRLALDQVRQLLLKNDRHGLLILLPGAKNIHAFLMDAGGVTHARLPSLEELAADVTALWRELATPPSTPLEVGRDRVTQLSKALSRRVFTDALAGELTSWDRVHVVGSEILDRIPFGVLELPDSGPLGTGREVVHLPSLQAGVLLAERAAPSSLDGGLLALVSPKFATGSDELEPVRFPAKAKARLRASWDSHGFAWRTAEEATLESLQTSSPLAATLIFTHGERDTSRPRPAGLRLASSSLLPDGRLFPEMIDALQGAPIAPLVILAVCGASATEVRAGSEDGDHLGAALLRRGAQLVLHSSAPLEQEATAELSAHLLDALARGASPASALKEARTRLRRDVRFDHPHYWATLIALGWDGQ